MPLDDARAAPEIRARIAPPHRPDGLPPRFGTAASRRGNSIASHPIVSQMKLTGAGGAIKQIVVKESNFAAFLHLRTHLPLAIRDPPAAGRIRDPATVIALGNPQRI